jgi:RNA polymerase sigma factor (sigma-70 family)
MRLAARCELPPIVQSKERRSGATYAMRADERKSRLELLFRQHSARVLDYAHSRGMSWAESEDVVAEVYLICWRRLDDVPPNALPWLFGVARRVVANGHRSHRRRDALRERAEQNLPSFFQEAPTDTSNLALLQALGQLSEPDQEILLLVAWDGLTYEEAARVLDCAVMALRVRFFRAKGRLLKRMGHMRTYSAVREESSTGKRAAS